MYLPEGLEDTPFKHVVRTLWSVNDVQPEYGLNELVYHFRNKPWRVSGGRVCDCTSLKIGRY